MQPRRERAWVEGETVFQVTKRGEEVIVLERWDVRRGDTPTGRKAGVLESGVVVVEGGVREDEEVEGVDEPLVERPPRRCRTGMRGVLPLLGLEDLAGSSGVDSSSSSERSSSRPLG